MSDAPDHPLVPRPTRDPRIDFWRGLCILGMAVWHLLSARLFDQPAFPSWLTFPAIQGFNFVAEGFVLLAGLAVGLTVSRLPAGSLRGTHYLRRAGLVLLVHYATVAVLLAVFTVPDRPADFVQAGTLDRVLAVLTLQYQPYLGDILSVFVFLFVATPVMLAVRHRWGDGGLLAASAALYAATILLAFAAPAWHGAIDLNHGGAFDFNTWQLVYVAGILLGVRYAACVTHVEERFWRWLALGAAAMLAAAAVYLAIKLSGRVPEEAKKLLVERHPLGPVRAVYIALQMLVIGVLTVGFWDRLARLWPVQAIGAFGRHSLTVFTASVLLDYALKAAISRWLVTFPANLAMLVIELGLMYLLARWLDRPEPTAQVSDR